MALHFVRSRLQVFLIFAFIGPLIGCIPFALMLLVAGLRDPAGPALGIVAFIFGYPIGIVPASIAGAVFVALSSAPLLAHVWRRRSLVLLLGALAGFLGGSALAGVLALAASPGLSVLVMLLLPSAISGVCCALISVRPGPIFPGAERWSFAVLAVAAFFTLLHLART
jgi:hypothetical protein